jgi:hypothetical protein
LNPFSSSNTSNNTKDDGLFASRPKSDIKVGGKHKRSAKQKHNKSKHNATKNHKIKNKR